MANLIIDVLFYQQKDFWQENTKLLLCETNVWIFLVLMLDNDQSSLNCLKLLWI